jgi:hypothetical protein
MVIVEIWAAATVGTTSAPAAVAHTITMRKYRIPASFPAVRVTGHMKRTGPDTVQDDKHGEETCDTLLPRIS